MSDFFLNLDHDLFVALHNAAKCGFMDSFMLLFTGKWLWVPFYVALAAMVIYKERPRRGVMFLVAIGLAIAVTDQTCQGVIRPIVERLRPCHPDSPIADSVILVDGYSSGSFSFPSCHAANSMLLAVFMALYVRRWLFNACIFAWAIIHSLSRIYLGVHFPGDLLVGWIIGAVFAFAFFFLWRYVSQSMTKEDTFCVKPLKIGHSTLDITTVPLLVLGMTTLIIVVISIF